MLMHTNRDMGIVYLVGAGPGDPGLITVKGRECIEKADVLAVMSSIEIQKYPQSIAATAKILNAAGESWTFRTDGYEATNFGMLSGNPGFALVFELQS